MANGLAKFRDRTTGPENFRLGLRLRTKCVRNFSTVLEGINGASMKIPESVLGGDLLGLMSGYLRRLLQQPEQPSDSMRTGALKTGFADLNDAKGALPEFGATRSIRHSGNRFASNSATSTQRQPFESTSDNTKKQRKNLFSRATPNETQRFFAPLDTRETVGPSIPQKEERSKEVSSLPQPVSMLSTKLEEYWELNRSQQSRDLADRGGTNSPVSSASGFSHGPTSTSPDRSLESIAGQQLAEKLKDFTARRIPDVNRRASSNSDLSPSVEIQNTFHVKVNNEPGGLGSLGELSDKIADILREQALQHGIDIT